MRQEAFRRTPRVDGALEPTPPALQRCIELFRGHSDSLLSVKRIHAVALRGGVAAGHPLLAKFVLFFASAAAKKSSSSALSYLSSALSTAESPCIFSVNLVIRACADSDDPRRAISLHRRALAPPDTHTFPFLLTACARIASLGDGERVHCEAIKRGFQALVFVGNSLIHMYATCGRLDAAHELFDEMRVRNLVSWNSIINGFASNSRPNEVLTLFRDMLHCCNDRVAPDGFTIVSVLCACAEISALALGKRVHVYVRKIGLADSSHVGNAMIDLFAKCGAVEDARTLFDGMPARTVVSWTSLVVGLAVNGFACDALEVFHAMEGEGLTPTDITMVGVLYACSHRGLVDDGFRHFKRMSDEYGIAPTIEHFGCMVDLLGRSGKVQEAMDYIARMPVQPNAVVWRTLLGACTMHKKLDVGLAAWDQLAEVDPGHSGDYVLLSNLYAAAGKWKDVRLLRKKMADAGIRKNPGSSLVEIGNKVYKFIIGDWSHPESEEICRKLDEIGERLRREGYVAGTSVVLADIEEEEKEGALSYHSERVAVAFALLKTAEGAPIRVVKNLRICDDCHTAMRLIAGAYRRRIIVRDRSRFHHFEGGQCSCGDYW